MYIFCIWLNMFKSSASNTLLNILFNTHFLIGLKHCV